MCVQKRDGNMARKLRLKRSRRKQLRLILIGLLLTCFMVLISLLGWHTDKLIAAKSSFDLTEAEYQLTWFQKHGSFLNKMSFIKDINLWNQLNRGADNNLIEKLKASSDDSHLFWLMQIQLQKGNIAEASQTLTKISSPTLRNLAEGVIALGNGQIEQAGTLLNDNKIKWSSLSKNDQTLRHLALTQVDLAMNEPQKANDELKTAQLLEPDNPACLSLSLSMAIWDKEWSKAQEIMKKIDAQTWRSVNPVYLTEKAILKVALNEPGLNEVLSQLTNFPKGQSFINYVQGIQALGKGDLSGGKIYLERALQSGLDGAFKLDAQQALDLAQARLNADKSLKPVLLGSGE